MTNLHSTTQKLGKTVTQIIHGINGTKLTFEGVRTETIKQGQMTKMMLKNGGMLMVHDKNVLAIESYSEDYGYGRGSR